MRGISGWLLITAVFLLSGCGDADVCGSQSSASESEQTEPLGDPPDDGCQAYEKEPANVETPDLGTTNATMKNDVNPQ